MYGGGRSQRPALQEHEWMGAARHLHQPSRSAPSTSRSATAPARRPRWFLPSHRGRSEWSAAPPVFASHGHSRRSAVRRSRSGLRHEPARFHQSTFAAHPILHGAVPRVPSLTGAACAARLVGSGLGPVSEAVAIRSAVPTTVSGPASAAASHTLVDRDCPTDRGMG